LLKGSSILTEMGFGPGDIHMRTSCGLFLLLLKQFRLNCLCQMGFGFTTRGLVKG